jgi:hypothetical protein
MQSNKMFNHLQGDVGGPVVINTAPVTATATPAVWTIAGINSYTKSKCFSYLDIWLQKITYEVVLISVLSFNS